MDEGILFDKDGWTVTHYVLFDGFERVRTDILFLIDMDGCCSILFDGDGWVLITCLTGSIGADIILFDVFE